MEVSEKERAARRAAKPKTNETPAQSFRLGKLHVERLKKLSERSDIPQVDLIRDMIDEKWNKVEKARAKRRAQ
jgi:predicted DNA-binding protein